MESDHKETRGHSSPILFFQYSRSSMSFSSKTTISGVELLMTGSLTGLYDLIFEMMNLKLAATGSFVAVSADGVL